MDDKLVQWNILAEKLHWLCNEAEALLDIIESDPEGNNELFLRVKIIEKEIDEYNNMITKLSEE